MLLVQTAVIEYNWQKQYFFSSVIPVANEKRKLIYMYNCITQLTCKTY